jgi:hypothetical protein
MHTNKKIYTDKNIHNVNTHIFQYRILYKAECVRAQKSPAQPQAPRRGMPASGWHNAVVTETKICRTICTSILTCSSSSRMSRNRCSVSTSSRSRALIRASTAARDAASACTHAGKKSYVLKTILMECVHAHKVGGIILPIKQSARMCEKDWR